jgi:hypothetical protein
MLGGWGPSGEGSETPSFCSRCGRPFGVEEMFCPHCGTPRPVTPPGSTWSPDPSTSRPAEPTAGPSDRPGRHLRPFLDVALVLAIVLVVVVVGLPAASTWLTQATTPSCTVGLNGAAVSVTVQGSTADAQCASMQQEITDGGTWYRYASGQQAAGASICQVSYAGGPLDRSRSGVARHVRELDLLQPR